jgi:hypothetical protein
MCRHGSCRARQNWVYRRQRASAGSERVTARPARLAVVRVSIRAARPDDVPALVQLRMANGERHAALDPSGHRVPEAAPVRRYFEELLSGPGGTGIVVLVAEAEGTVAGMTELVIRSEPPPDHQILVPRPLASNQPSQSCA